ncbi:MAG: hypothetical protein R3250_15160, partial [Melioribacteraceae bacterium]|nr:hypothetical protein [Melioribacteraceae bacterium]
FKRYISPFLNGDAGRPKRIKLLLAIVGLLLFSVALAGVNAINELANANGVEYVFSGNYYLNGNNLILKSKVVNTKTGEVEYYLPDYQSSKEEPIAAVKELTERIMGYWLNKDQITARKTTPPRLEAYKAYLKGREEYTINAKESARYFTEAISLDSSYFEPYLFLSFVYNHYTTEPDKADSVFQRLNSLNQSLTPYQESII